jgi:hypothetical protein
MRKIYIFYRFLVAGGLLLLTCFVQGQLVSDDFSDGDITTGVVWTGETTKHTVNATFQLQTAGPGVSDTAYLVTTTGTLDVSQPIVWEFYFKLNFNPSTTNNARIYLMSNNPNLRGPLQGYFVRIGENSIPDRLQFYRQNGTTTTLLFSGSTNTFEITPEGRVKVTRATNGEWTFETDATGGSNFQLEGTHTDNTYTNSGYFGFWSKYSTTNSTNFIYDDVVINGSVVVDVTPPVITAVNAPTDNTLTVTFDEPVSNATASVLTNYSVNLGVGNPLTAAVNGTNLNQADLTFAAGAFANSTTYTLTTQLVEDFSGNAMATSTNNFVYFVSAPPATRDVVINEIFADPSPQIGLPDAEFIELYNRSNQIYDLAGWKFSDASSTITLPSYVLMPGAYVAIAPNSAAFEFSIFPNVLLVSSLPSLNNASDLLTIYDPADNIIDQVEYFDSWYQDPIKKNGGYSLELINPDLPCSGYFNWIASNDPNGGTPGTQNSVYSTAPDGTPPIVNSVNVIDKNTIVICFNEGLDGTAINTSMVSLSGGVSVASFELSPDFLCLTLNILPALDTGFIYQVNLQGIKDCSGNPMVAAQYNAILPHLPRVGDVIVNEILFNPYTGGSDWVEVYNNSSRYIDLKGFFLANYDDGFVDNYREVTTNFLMYPNTFSVICRDSNQIKDNYISAVPGRFVQLASTLPTYTNDSSTVYLLLPDSTISDAVSYSSDWHFSIIKDVKGKSLERLDYNRASQDEGNWHTAAQAEGWATPGKENSQFFATQLTDEMVSITPELFSPDNDGFEDVMNISYKLNEPGFVGNITIFDREGRVIKYLVQNQLLATQGVYTWDGTTNSLEKARIGVYVIYFEVFNLDGEVSSIKKTCVVGGRF